MLNAKALTQVLQSGLGRGVENVLCGLDSIINKEGALLAAAANVEDARTLGAVLATTWGDYDAVGVKVLKGAEEMDTFMLEGENGKIIGGVIKSLALCVKGAGELGLLHETLVRLRAVLEPQLHQILEELE